MIIVSKYIDLAASRVGIINGGEPLDPASSTLILEILKHTLDEMSIQYYCAKMYDKTIAGKNPITLGSLTADIVDRPAKIDVVQIERSGIKYKLSLKNYSEYLSLSTPNYQGLPQVCFIKDDADLITLNFYPQISTSDVVNIVGKDYMTPDDLTFSDYIEVPREFTTGIVSTLALKIAPHFGLTVDNGLIIEASSGLKHIKAKMMAEFLMQSPQNDYNGSNYNSKHNVFTFGGY